MGFKCVIIALAIASCLCIAASAQGPKNIEVDPTFPGANMSGSQIYQEVRSGTFDDLNDSELSFRNESLFTIRKDTGMSPHAAATGVRTPVVVVGVPAVAGSWALTLNDVERSYLKLDLYQSGDAVFGSGELGENGFVTPVTVGGSVLGDRLALFVIPNGSQNMYRFSLTVQPGSMNGEYLFTAQGVNQPGVAFGSLISPQSINPASLTASAPNANATAPVA